MTKITVKQEKAIDAVLQIIGKWKSDKAVTPPLFFEDEFAGLDAELVTRIRASLEYLGEAILRTKN
jgi:hypothetical protein